MSDKKIPFEGARWEQEGWTPEDSDHAGKLNTYLERVKRAESTVKRLESELARTKQSLAYHQSRESEYRKVLGGRDSKVNGLTADRDKLRTELDAANEALETLRFEAQQTNDAIEADREERERETLRTKRKHSNEIKKLQKDLSLETRRLNDARSETERVKERLKREGIRYNRLVIGAWGFGILGVGAFLWALAGAPLPMASDEPGAVASEDNSETVLANCVYQLQNSREGREIGQPISGLANVLNKPSSLLLGENDRMNIPDDVILSGITYDTQNFSPKRVEWSANITLPESSVLEDMTINAYRIAPIEGSNECRLIWQGRLFPKDGSLYLSGGTTRSLTLSTTFPPDLANVEGARWFFIDPRLNLRRYP